MKRFEFSVPPTWQTVSPGRFGVGETILRVSELGPLPEDLSLFMDSEMRRAAAGAPFAGVDLQAVPLASGWPAYAAETTLGENRKLVMAIQLVDRGVLVWLDGPAGSFDAARAQVLEALGQGTLVWGEPELWTLAELLDGIK